MSGEREGKERAGAAQARGTPRGGEAEEAPRRLASARRSGAPEEKDAPRARTRAATAVAGPLRRAQTNVLLARLRRGRLPSRASGEGSKLSVQATQALNAAQSTCSSWKPRGRELDLGRSSARASSSSWASLAISSSALPSAHPRVASARPTTRRWCRGWGQSAVNGPAELSQLQQDASLGLLERLCGSASEAREGYNVLLVFHVRDALHTIITVRPRRLDQPRPPRARRICLPASRTAFYCSSCISSDCLDAGAGESLRQRTRLERALRSCRGGGC